VAFFRKINVSETSGSSDMHKRASVLNPVFELLRT
jgi:hypothetical protein